MNLEWRGLACYLIEPHPAGGLIYLSQQGNTINVSHIGFNNIISIISGVMWGGRNDIYRLDGFGSDTLVPTCASLAFLLSGVCNNTRTF